MVLLAERSPCGGFSTEEGIQMSEYEVPTVTELGTVEEITLTMKHKAGGSGDFLITNGTPAAFSGAS